MKQKLDNGDNGGSGSDKTTAQGRALVSRRVSVLWDDDGKWYSGIIADYRTIRGRSEHQIVYDVDGGAVMRTVDQAQKLLAGGTTTHEWLVFEASPNSKDPKLNWRFIQGEPISDNSSSLEDKANNRGGRRGPGPNAKGSKNPPPSSVGTLRNNGSSNSRVENNNLNQSGNKMVKGLLSGLQDFDDTFMNVDNNFNALAEMAGEGDFASLMDDIQDPAAKSSGSNRTGGNNANQRPRRDLDESGHEQWGNLFLPFEIDQDEEENTMPDTGFGGSFNHIFGDNYSQSENEDEADAVNSDEYDEFESTAANASQSNKGTLNWRDNQSSKGKAGDLRSKKKGKKGSAVAGDSSTNSGAGASTNSSTASSTNNRPAKKARTKPKEPEYFTFSSKELTLLWLKEHGLQKPIVVTDAKNLDFKLPDQKLGITEFCRKLGNENVLPGWRVKAQTEIKLKISEWAQHFAISGRPKMIHPS